jgi:hypothetical protein
MAMIYHNPPSAILSQAEVVTLLDLNVPGWKEVVVSRKVGLRAGSGDLAVINIPVNSKDVNELRDWRERIALAKA